MPIFGHISTEDDRYTFRFRSMKTLQEAVDLVRAPPLHATRAELKELFDGMRDPAHRRAYAAKDAIWVDAPSVENLTDHPSKPLAELDEESAQHLIALSETSWIRTPSKHRDELERYCAQSGPVSDFWLVLEVWLVREDGKLKIAAVVTH